jgi:hypothetical protein
MNQSFVKAEMFNVGYGDLDQKSVSLVVDNLVYGRNLGSPSSRQKGSGFCTNGTIEQGDLQGPIVTGRSTLDRDNLKSG